MFAVAVNCAVAPAAGDDPVTVTDETVEADGADGVDELPLLPPQAHINSANCVAMATPRLHLDICPPRAERNPKVPLTLR
jgi:hypothetical protein